MCSIFQVCSLGLGLFWNMLCFVFIFYLNIALVFCWNLLIVPLTGSQEQITQEAELYCSLFGVHKVSEDPSIKCFRCFFGPRKEAILQTLHSLTVGSNQKIKYRAETPLAWTRPAGEVERSEWEAVACNCHRGRRMWMPHLGCGAHGWSCQGWVARPTGVQFQQGGLGPPLHGVGPPAGGLGWFQACYAFGFWLCPHFGG